MLRKPPRLPVTAVTAVTAVMAAQPDPAGAQERPEAAVTAAPAELEQMARQAD
jgi:hypothetical protein